jgi:hypothetical protein
LMALNTQLKLQQALVEQGELSKDQSEKAI